MKRIIMGILAVVTIFAVAGCNNKKGGEPEFPEGSGPVEGVWHMVSWSGISSDRADIYISFSGDGKFELYQRVYSSFYEHYEGSYTQDEDIVQGTYADGQPWRDSYKVSLTADSSQLTLTGSTDPSDVTVYEKVGSIPDEILSGDLSSKSSSDDGFSGFRFL